MEKKKYLLTGAAFLAVNALLEQLHALKKAQVEEMTRLATELAEKHNEAYKEHNRMIWAAVREQTGDSRMLPDEASGEGWALDATHADTGVILVMHADTSPELRDFLSRDRKQQKSALDNMFSQIAARGLGVVNVDLRRFLKQADAA